LPSNPFLYTDRSCVAIESFAEKSLNSIMNTLYQHGPTLGSSKTLIGKIFSIIRLW